MGKLSEVLSGRLTTLTAEDLRGVYCIRTNCFTGCVGLTAVALPHTVKFIDQNAFYGCPLETIDTSALEKDCLIEKSAFTTSTWPLYDGTSRVLMGKDDCIMYQNESGSTEIPACVRNIVGLAFTSLDSSITSVTIPDTVEILYGGVVFPHGVTTVTVGSGVCKMGVNTMYSGSSGITWIFRQPAGMTVELPTAGDGTGLNYNKDSRTITIYTDNECIINYNWSGDNITANIYPLADAPE